MEDFLGQALLLLGITLVVVLALRRLHVPTILAYVVVGLLVGPHTPGPTMDTPQLRQLAEFGVVFLLFTIGLNFSLPKLKALRPRLFGMGIAQVVLTAAIVGAIAWLAGAPPAAAFVIGAVFAQSSTTIIDRVLVEQREDQSRHGRVSLAMSVFQDVTAVPFVVVIPVLGAAAGAFGTEGLAGHLGAAVAKAVLAFAAVFAAGRWMLRPLFRLVAARRSAEVFTLAVLFVSLASAAITQALGLSMAFGAFLAGMMIGDTEFRHQVESAIRPFRDVLLGLFFVGIGMLFDPAAALRIWPWALGGTAALLAIKALAVAAIVRVAGSDSVSAWRTGLILAVGGEFGFALVAIAVAADTIDANAAQVALTSVLLSMIAGPFLIRHNHAIARRLAPARPDLEDTVPLMPPDDAALLSEHVIICGYGRIGQSVGHVLEDEKIPYVALDLDPARVRQAKRVGERVFYADGSDRDLLDAVGLATARLVVVCHDDVPAAMKLLAHVRNARTDLPVMVRTRDESHVEALRAAGATEVVPETLEAGLMIATHALLLLDIPIGRVVQRLQGQQSARYRLLHEFFRGVDAPADAGADRGDRLHAVVVPTIGSAAGRRLSDLGLRQVVVAAIVRRGRRLLAPPPETPLEGGDAVVLFGSPGDTAEAERILLT